MRERAVKLQSAEDIDTTPMASLSSACEGDTSQHKQPPCSWWHFVQYNCHHYIAQGCTEILGKRVLSWPVNWPVRLVHSTLAEMHLCTVGEMKFMKQCVILEENGPGVIVAATEDAKSACELASSADPCAMIACKSSLFLFRSGLAEIFCSRNES